FDNPYNSGIRTMVSTPHGLAVGTVNPFGPEVAVKRGETWEYVDNPRGGLEVWLGNAAGREADDDDREDEILQADGGPAGDLRPGQMIYPRDDFDAAGLEWNAADLRRASKRIDVQSVRPDFVAFAHKLHHLKLVGEERIPATGPILFVANHVGSPVL